MNNCQLKDRILRYDRMVPRYTSYPTAPHFRPGFDHKAYADWLTAIPQESRLSLYLHVPFCPKMCWYCGCHTKITRRYAPVEDYAHLLIREIEILGGVLGSSRKATNIHFGGGSPGMLRARDFSLIMETLAKTFTITSDAEIALEIDPREITENRIKAYADHGLNRASIGVQDFNDETLKAVNREQPFELTQKTVEMLRNQDIEGINFDLLYGLPYQTVKTMEETIEKSVSLSPSRFALFGYAHVPWMKKHMRLIPDQSLPQKEIRYDLFEKGSNLLQEAGYLPVGIDHFARPDDELIKAYKNKTLRRNFQGYTTDNADVMLGLGASSIGKLTGGYVQNSPDMPVYTQAILDGHLPTVKSCAITAEDRLRADVIEQIMCFFEVNLPEICKKHGVPTETFTADLDKLTPWIEDGLVTLSDEQTITIAENARPTLTRLVSAAFDAYLPAQDPATPRHARAI
ncbi:MAG: oxygen-independent coproporphyrinogen III oxidase [Alphaproteobacteria bacterium]|nr:oxygen-independent coproporphyrinogen III oxidase [Alphaproteobacteria bacterium]